jgi:hypothetical protein
VVQPDSGSPTYPQPDPILLSFPPQLQGISPSSSGTTHPNLLDPVLPNLMYLLQSNPSGQSQSSAISLHLSQINIKFPSNTIVPQNKCKAFIPRNTNLCKHLGREVCLTGPGRVVDILEACGAFDPGSSPGRGVDFRGFPRFVFSGFFALGFVCFYWNSVL